MATPVILPKQGQSVETCLLIEWKKNEGDTVAVGDVLCEVETDKASFEVEAPSSGTLLAHFYAEESDVPVLSTIAVIGEAGENIDDLRPTPSVPTVVTTEPEPVVEAAPSAGPIPPHAPDIEPAAAASNGAHGISPRARRTAQARGVVTSALTGTGPHGRLIERDIIAAAERGPLLTPAAQAELEATGAAIPTQGSGIGGRVVAADLASPAAAVERTDPVESAERTETPLKGVRKLIAERMLASLQTTAQLTLNSSAPAAALLDLRKQFKASGDKYGLGGVTLNDLILFATARTLADAPELNCLFSDDTIYQYKPVHLAFAVDTPRGLMVPVIRNADSLTVKALSAQAKTLARACMDGKIMPDDLNGGTFTVSNLGNFGIESFTPVLNPPQVAILGVGSVNLRPVEVAGSVTYSKQLSLSLTINHQVVDGAPAARFLQSLANAIADIELLLFGS